MVFGWFAELGPATPECYARPIPSVCFVMRKVKSHWPAGDVYLSSSVPASVDRGYHRIWGWVKEDGPTTTSWGWGDEEGIPEKTICKAVYQFGRGFTS